MFLLTVPAPNFYVLCVLDLSGDSSIIFKGGRPGFTLAA